MANTSNNTSVNNNLSNNSILRGGHVDALIVLATSANSSVHAATHSIKTLTSSSKLPPPTTTTSTSSSSSLSCHHLELDEAAKVNFLYQEAFLTTYRTILQPSELINKLMHRYKLFATSSSSNESTHKASNYNETSSINRSVSGGGGGVADEKFDLNRLRLMNKQAKMSASAARNSLSLLIRVVDDLEE